MNQRDRVKAAAMASVALVLGVGIGVTGSEANREPTPPTPVEREWKLLGKVRAEDDAWPFLDRQEGRCGGLPAEIEVLRAEDGLWVWGRCTRTFRAGP